MTKPKNYNFIMPKPKRTYCSFERFLKEIEEITEGERQATNKFIITEEDFFKLSEKFCFEEKGNQIVKSNGDFFFMEEIKGVLLGIEHLCGSYNTIRAGVCYRKDGQLFMKYTNSND